MIDLVIGTSVCLLTAAVGLFWLYRLVAKNQHADREAWQTFCLALGIVTAVTVCTTTVVGILLVILFGHTGAKATAWVFFAAIAEGWILAQRQIRKPPRGFEILKFRSLLVNDVAVPIAIAVAIGGLFFIHNYDPKSGLFNAAQKGEIYLTAPQPIAGDTGPFADLVPDTSIKLPYRDLLAICLLLVAINLGSRYRKKPPAELEPP